MFLNLLKPEEKSAYLTLARRVISADSTIAKEEQTLLEAMKRELELSDEGIDYLPDSLSIRELCDMFVSSKSKVSALMELIGIGFVDGQFVHQEKEVIYQIAESMGISKDETTMYIDWAKRVYVN
ncbi:MAG: hypothetical protein MUE85_05475 [Microscillaceae bacterium]|jgi:uncharacterized tellurite resistance protein B-like protein|nr:hypothetical protein [Microscillaceae bacterium]